MTFRIGAVAAIATVALAATLVPSAAAAPADAQVLDRPLQGRTAVAALGANAPEVAAINSLSEGRLRSLLESDETFGIDKDGRAFYADAAAPPIAQPTGPTAEQAPFPYADTFLLHSKAGSSRVIYLDFDGVTLSSTAWNASFSVPNGTVAPPFDLDGSPGSFSSSELDLVQSVFLRVAEDYAPFDVDVTTQDPGEAAITRAGAGDTVYGTRAVITNAPAIRSLVCSSSCGGIAYTGVFDIYGVAGGHPFYQPALIFQDGLGGTGTSAKVVAEATSHEVGHNLGLNHDGTATASYYSGHGPWAPIMGVGYNRPIVQFSAGAYAGANNTQDDLAIIAAHGALIRADDHADGTAGATPLPVTGASVGGIITTASDTDWFQITASGPATVTASPAAVSPDLDIRLDLFTSTGASTEVFSDPSASMVSADVASGLGASLVIPSAGVWYVRVDGVGFGLASSTGYSDYASLGRYTIAATAGAPTGLLRVITSPAVPSQILVDGVPADSWGVWVTTATGPHQVCFGDVPGYVTPACQAITVTVGTTSTVTGSFAQLGTLRVVTSPAVPSTIRVDGTPRDDWGLWTDLSAGVHVVCFDQVAGWTPPGCQVVTLTAGSPSTVTGTFVAAPDAPGPPPSSVLRVTTSPALPSQIVVDGVPRDTWGAWFSLPAGSHEVCFTALEGTTPPPCQTVTTTTGTTTTVTGTFSARGSLRVLTSPAVASTIVVDGIGRDDWGLWTDLPPGPVTVCFGPVSGWAAPACQTAALTAGALTTVTGVFTP